MRAQIRLAERQGLLTGKDLSTLQVTAIYYREIEDMAERTDERRQGFKYALLSTGRFAIDDLFPELFAEVEEDDSAEFASEEENVTYKFAERGELSPEEMERELQQLMAGGDVTVNGGEFDGSS